LVFALEEDHPVARVDELVDLDPMLVPDLLVALEVPPDLDDAAPHPAFLDAADGPVQLHAGVGQLRHSVPIRPLPAFYEPARDLHVFLPHPPSSLSSSLSTSSAPTGFH